MSGSVSHVTASDGTRIWYDVLGEGDPLLLFNGQSLDHEMWDGPHAALAGRHRVVRMDFRGTGGSGAPLDQPYTLDLFVDDALAVLDALGIDRAHVYGFSMGGKVAQRFAVRAPERLGALVLGATAPGGPHEVERPRESTLALRRAGTAAGREMIGPLFYSPGWADAHPDTVARVLPRGPLRAQRLHFGASGGHDGWDALPSIQAPTLVVHGEDDELTPVGNAALLAERIPNARLLVLPGLRHGYLHEDEAKATREVLDFLAGHPLGWSADRSR
ncbi:alpha/beta fold hydrolase [Nocardiopsis lambiniae]|uniref:Alpha/beta hydrolase n=1 Tax=Nocardiopsis lambiniae TaxID=3075539 RepID=A0ABU2M356_9ACTN|nr:alpha/beta hydrolase [Nocardiopsis sp. DSM 44743]MDT0327070.1 alpha/beta hydrolase [Nocardiopsis sp. DSM 44743]